MPKTDWNLLVAIQSGHSHWANDPRYPPEDWQCEVQNGDTRLGYAQWVEGKRSAEE